MAVEIPIYVDISGAFDRAVREIPKEVPKLEKVLSNYALNLKIDMGGGSFKTVRNLLTDTTMDAEELELALKRVRKAFNDAVAMGAKSNRTSGAVNGLAKAYGLLEQRAKGFYNSNAVAAMRLEDTIAKVTYKIRDLQSQMMSLTAGTDKYNKLNYQLQIQSKRLSELTIQQLKYRAGIDASTDSFRKQSVVVKQLTGYFSGLYAAHTLLRFVKQVRDVTGELEYQRTALGHLIQDTQFGNELFEKTIEAAKQSPFRIGQLVTYTKQLAAYRIEQDKLFETTQRLADISAGLGVDMNRLILAYGQVRAASVLRGQELRQFTEAGIPLVEELAKKFRQLGREGTTTADVFKLISERAVPFEMIKEIFEDLTDAGGMFYKMQEEQAKTLKGRWEKLKDAYDQALMKLGDSSTFQGWNDRVLSILNGLAENLNKIVRAVNAGSVAWVAYWLTTKTGIVYGVRLSAEFIKEYGLVTTLKFGVNGLAAAFKKLWAAMKTNWVGLAISAIAGLVTWFTTFNKKTKDATDQLSDMQKAIESMKSANEKFALDNKIIDQFESLSKVTEKTAGQSKQLSSAVEELKRTYPDLAEKIGNANVPLGDQIDLLRKAAEAAHNLSIEEAKNRLITQGELIRGLEDDYNAAKQEKEIAERRLKEAQKAEAAGPITEIADWGEYEEKSAKTLKKETIEAAQAAKEAEDNYDKIAEDLTRARREAEELRKLAFPEDVKSGLAEWQKMLINASKYTSDGITKQIFTPQDVKSWDSLGEAIKKLKPQFKEAKETYEGLVSSVKKGSDKIQPALIKERDSAKDAFDAWTLLNDLLGGLLSTRGGGNNSYTQDPFIKRMQDRMKFMKDFQKGYEDLQKYMSSSAAADKEAKIMLKRGLSMGIDPEEQRRAAEDLSQWYQDTMDRSFEYLQKEKGVTGTLNEFLSRQITGKTNRDKMLRDFQSMLQSMFDAKTDFDTSKLTKDIDDALKRVTDEIKRSETARNFYNNILDMTGDEKLSESITVSVYGGIGEDFKDRIQKQLVGALNSLDDESLSGLSDAIKNAFSIGDYDYLVKHLEEVPEKLRDTVKQVAGDAEKYNADWVKDIIKTYEKTKEYDERITDVRKREAQKRKEINESKLSPDQKATFTAASQKKEEKEIADIELERLKNTYEWTQAFKDLERVSTSTLKELIKLLDEYIEKSGPSASPESRKAVEQAKEQAREQIISRDAYSEMFKSIKGYTDNLTKAKELRKELNELEKDGKKDTKEYSDKYLEYIKALDASRDSLKDVDKSISAIGDSFNTLSSIVSSLSDVLDLDELSDGEAVLSGIATGLGLIGTALVFINGIMTLLESNPIVLAISATIAAVASLATVINNLSVAKANREIEAQNKLLKELEYRYGKLEQAMEKSFGSDYIYNYTKQLEILAAKIDAYNAQAEAERSKGKKSDEEKVKEYLDSARDAQDQIDQMKTKLSEFFSGTDLTSAAEQFAEAWIEAYKEFGSTTDAMSEKFNDMIESMINKSLAAKIMQEMLEPIFNEIDTLSKDGLLSTSEIAQIADLAQQRIPLINDAMTNLMTSLASAGLDVRKSTAGFNGISKEIAGASEESILALAAGINTQNFYMSYMPSISEKVSQILAAITGTYSPTTPVETNENGEVLPSVQKMVYDYLPSIYQKLDSLESTFRSVVTSKGGTSTNTNCVAVR